MFGLNVLRTVLHVDLESLALRDIEWKFSVKIDAIRYRYIGFFFICMNYIFEL